MNGPKIEIFKPFGDAFELTKKILFQPFDIKKWFVIGFAAFLTSLSGGTHLNFNGRSFKDINWRSYSWSETAGGEPWAPWVIPVVVVGILCVLALVALFMWLGSRGRFIFTDCIVRNRGAIVEPWHEYRAEGNSFFLFCLLVLAGFLAIASLIGLPFILALLAHRPLPDFGITGMFVPFLFLGGIGILALGWTVISQLMVPVMYRRRCGAGIAFKEALSLIASYPGPVILYFLFLFLLLIAAALIGCFSACITCCITAIPYIGTVILLPLPVFLHSYTLLFVRQFGPDYDVWANIAPTEPPPPPAPEPLPG